MKSIELIEKIKKDNPKLLSGIPERKAVALIRNVLNDISSTIDDTEEGTVNIGNLGIFRVISKQNDGEGESRKIIRFKPVRSKRN